jgi:hypothetical protein
MMDERGKSDSAVRAVKPANKAERSAAELVEQRAGTKGKADQQSTRRAQIKCSRRASSAVASTLANSARTCSFKRSISSDFAGSEG